MSHVKPRSLKPMTRKQKLWLVLTIILFVICIGVGWTFTVARALQQSFRESNRTISGSLIQTKEQFIGEKDLGQATQETIEHAKSFFQNVKQSFENKQKAEQAILDNVKEELKTSSH